MILLNQESCLVIKISLGASKGTTDLVSQMS